MFASMVLVLASAADNAPLVICNAELLNAMPPGVTSIFVRRLADLPQALFVECGDKDPAAIRHYYKGDDLKTTITREALLARPAIIAYGGSDFTFPDDSGKTGNFNERCIYVLGESIRVSGVQLQAKSDGPPRSVVVNGRAIPVFSEVIQENTFWGSARCSAGERWFVALYGQRIVVTGESLEDIEYMLRKVADRDNMIPVRWSTVAGSLNIDSPAIVLRYFVYEYAPSPTASWVTPPVSIGAKHMAIALDGNSRLQISVTASAASPAELAEWLAPCFGRNRLTPTIDDDVFVGNTVFVAAHDRGVESLSLSLFSLFGLIMML